MHPTLLRRSLAVHAAIVVLLVLWVGLMKRDRAPSVPAAPKRGLLVPGAPPPACVSQDRANPLAAQYPDRATGVLNATLAIVPIPLAAARALVPARYPILERAYRALVPDFPAGMYPVLVQAAHDHDVQMRAYGITLEDFSRVGFEFPFLDLLADGHTSFRWAPAQLLSGTHDVAVEGSQAYGTRVSRAAAWEPACDAYAAIPPLPASSSSAPLYRFRGTGASAGEFVELVMARLDAQDASARGRGSASPYPYPLALFRNVTNQPSFADGRTCGNMIRPFNTSLSEGPFAPAPVRGTVRAGRTFPFFDGETGQAGEVWEGVYGVQVATPFIENNYLECRSLQGYRGTGGSGDSHVE